MAEQAGVRWTIRGVPLELREAAEQAAGSKHRLGEWIADAIRRALEATDSVSDAGGGIAYRAELDALSERLAAVEKALALSPNQDRQEAAAAEPVSRAVSAAAAGAKVFPKGGRSLTAEEIAEVIRLRRDEGLSQGKIAKRFGVSQSLIQKELSRRLP